MLKNLILAIFLVLITGCLVPSLEPILVKSNKVAIDYKKIL